MVVGVGLGLHGEKVCVTIPAGIVVREAGKYFMLRPFFFVWNREHPQMRKILHFFLWKIYYFSARVKLVFY